MLTFHGEMVKLGDVGADGIFPMRYSVFAACALLLGSTPALACPDDQYEGWPGICYPKVGGSVGQAWEKLKRETANFERDVRVWIETGKCGGDICDAFAAAVDFAKSEIVDAGESLKNAGERLSEGKPIDALWHLSTDPLKNSQENAAEAAMRSRVLQATGQVAASVYGGPAGAAGYTAWLTYHATGGNVGDALKAGVISGVSAYALQGIDEIDLAGGEGVVARAVLTGAVNGTAVALAGGDQKSIQAAVGIGITSVVIREGYRKLTDFELNKQRLRASTGEAYCLGARPDSTYLDVPGSPAGCFAPRETYIRGADGKGDFDMKKFSSLDPDRPHVGVFADGTEGPLNIAAENSGVMTGISRLPGWNAMAVGHDVLASNLEIDILGPLNTVSSVATIPPAVVITYIASGETIHDMIRDAAKRSENADDGPRLQFPARAASGAAESSMQPPETPKPIEMTHIICQRDGGVVQAGTARTDLQIETSVAGTFDDRPFSRVCEIRQLTNGVWYELGHAHHEKNYCHRLAERIVKRRQKLGSSCYGSVGMKSPTSTQTEAKAQASPT